MGMFATGVTVVTAGRDNPHGMTANAFTSVSLEPPMVLVCVVRTAVLHQTVIDSGGFAISVMSARQGHVAKYFASRSRPRDETEFNGVDWAPGPHTGAPVLGGNLAWLECELTAVYDGGDHSIFLGTVLDLGRSGGEDALLFLGGSFYEFDADKQ
ncbi:flavin reductase family protein [Longispora fulva]|nr:flavin reductase family protein [Longispora fulva]